ncbi:MAG: HEAT repeat domain-containing protein [Oligoflexia bacterium]|nr:HEAT repeat domain-containing protein [Oligoflexia bacterium]
MPTAQDLQGLGDGVGAELLEMALDPSLTHTQRARATVALGWFPTDASLATLGSLLAGSDDLLARKAAFALATGWADHAVPLLTTALASDSVQLRMATTRALGSLRSDSAKAALSHRLDAETNSAVQDLIRAQLTN